jgi:PAS domain S-box-containing protein
MDWKRLPHLVRNAPGLPLVFILILVLAAFLSWSLARDRARDLVEAKVDMTMESVNLADLVETALGGATVVARQVASDVGTALASGDSQAMGRFQPRLTAFVAGFPGLEDIVVHDRVGHVLAQARSPRAAERPLPAPPDRESWTPTPTKPIIQTVEKQPGVLRVATAITDEMGQPRGAVSVLVDLKALMAIQDKPSLCREIHVNAAWVLGQGHCAPVTTAREGGKILSGRSRVASNDGIVVVASITERQALDRWRDNLWPTLGLATLALVLLGGVVASILRNVAHDMEQERIRTRENALLAEALAASGLGTWEWSSREGAGRLRGGDPPIPDLEGVTWMDRVLPRDRGVLRADLEAQERGLPVSLDRQVRLDLGEGTPRWIRFRGRLATETVGTRTLTRVTGLWADVTNQRHGAMERLRLATAVEKGPVAVIMTDADGHIDYVNRKFQDMMGYEPVEVLGQSPNLLASGLTDPEIHADLWSHLTKGNVWSGELVNRHKNGHLVWHHVSISPILAEETVIGYVAMYQDISDRKRLQENLNMQVAMMRAVLDISPNGILVADLHGRPRLINLRLRRLWGLTEEIAASEEPGLMFETMARKVQDPDRFLATVHALNETPRETEVGVEVALRDGRIIERLSLAVEDHAGTPWGRVWFFREVTEQKRVERALSDQLEFQHTLMDTLPNPVFHMDRQQRFLGCNAAFGSLVGRSPEAVFGALAEELFPQERARRLTEGNGDLLAQGGMYRGEITLMGMDGVFRDMALSKAGFTDTQGHVSGIVGILTDVSNLKQATEELRRSNQELEQFAYVASHDLQEPLRMVSSYLGLLKRRYADRLDGDAEEFIGYAVDGAHRMQDLIQDLLHFSRIDTRGNPLEPTSTRLCLDMAKENLRVAMEEASALLTIDPLPMVMADDAQLTSLFQNLLGNAVKYRAADRRPEIRVSAEQDGDFWRFSVADNGIGIDPQFSEKVFMIFQRLQTRDRYPGTGIGLAVVKKIVERHGGRIWLDGKEGVGTTFYFTLRAIPEELNSFSETAE